MRINTRDLIGGGELVTDTEKEPGTRFAHYACASQVSYRGFGWMVHTRDDGVTNAGTWTNGPCYFCGKEMRIVKEVGVEIHF